MVLKKLVFNRWLKGAFLNLKIGLRKINWHNIYLLIHTQNID